MTNLTHVTRFDITTPNATYDGYLYRPVCLCGWRGEWHPNYLLSDNEGDAHVAAALICGAA